MIKKAKDEKPNEFEHSREYVPIKPLTGPPQDLVIDAIAAIFAKTAELLSKTRGYAREASRGRRPPQPRTVAVSSDPPTRVPHLPSRVESHRVDPHQVRASRSDHDRRAEADPRRPEGSGEA